MGEKNIQLQTFKKDLRITIYTYIHTHIYSQTTMISSEIYIQTKKT